MPKNQHSASVKKTVEGKWVGCIRSGTSSWARGIYQDSKSQTYVPQWHTSFECGNIILQLNLHVWPNCIFLQWKARLGPATKMGDELQNSVASLGDSDMRAEEMMRPGQSTKLEAYCGGSWERIEMRSQQLVLSGRLRLGTRLLGGIILEPVRTSICPSCCSHVVVPTTLKSPL